MRPTATHSSSSMAEQGIAALAEGLPLIARNAQGIEGRTQALYGAWLCGTCLGSSAWRLHHKICHTLGGTFDLPHAETHAIMLPHALAFNLPAAPEARARLARVLGSAEPARALASWPQRGSAERPARHRHAGDRHRPGLPNSPFATPTPTRGRSSAA